MLVVVGCIVVKDDSFVLVQEAQPQAYGKWNLPLGHLEENEEILAGALRESEEETGLKLKLDGFVGIYQRLANSRNVIKIIFSASVVSGNIHFQKEELLDAKWISFADFEKMPKSDIRSLDIIEAINDFRKRGTLPLEHVRLIKF